MSHPVAGHQDDPDPFAGLWQAVVTSSKVPSPVIAMGGGRHAGPSCSIASFVLTENDSLGFGRLHGGRIHIPLDVRPAGGHTVPILEIRRPLLGS